MGVGPGLCRLPGISLLGTWVNMARRRRSGAAFTWAPDLQTLPKKLTPTHDPTSEAGTGIARRPAHRIRPKHLLRVRVVTLRDVGVVVAPGVDDHRAAVPVEELPKPEAIGVELLFRMAV